MTTKHCSKCRKNDLGMCDSCADELLQQLNNAPELPVKQSELELLKIEYQNLVAENAAMRKAIGETIGWQESVDASNAESVRLLVAIKTPATDAAIAEIESVGAEKMFNLVEPTARNFCNPQVTRLVLEELAILATDLRAGRKG